MGSAVVSQCTCSALLPCSPGICFGCKPERRQQRCIMKFGHLLKEFGQEAEVPPDALLNYKASRAPGAGLLALLQTQRRSRAHD